MKHITNKLAREAGFWGDVVVRSSAGRSPERAMVGCADGDRRGSACRLDHQALKTSGQGKGEAGHEKAEPEEDRLVLVPCRCRSWCCPKCCFAYAAKVRARIMPHLSMFKRPRMLTLTVDRSKFKSGEEAHKYVEGEELIQRFLNQMGFKKAVKVLAFHPKNPDWPHWHVLVDLADCGSWVDMKRAWRLWRDKWGVGGLDLQLRQCHGDGEEAVRYAFSYMQHQAGKLPKWVTERPRAPRCWEVYGLLRKAIQHAQKVRDGWRGVPASKADPACSDGDGQEAKPKRSRSLVSERLARCGEGTVLLLRQAVAGVGYAWRWVGSLVVRPGAIGWACMMGDLPSLDVRREWRGTRENWSVGYWCPVDQGSGAVKSLVDRLRWAAVGLSAGRAGPGAAAVEALAEDPIPF